MVSDVKDPGPPAKDPPGAGGEYGEPPAFEGDEDPTSPPPYDLPDTLGEVKEIAGMMSSFAADRFVRVAALRREAHAEAVPFRGGIPELIERSLRLELACALQLTETAAEQLLTRSQAMVDRYPAMLASLGRGRTTERHAEVMVDLVAAVEDALLERVVPAAVEMAEELPLGTFRRELRKLVDTVRAATLAERHAEALTQRRVVVTPADDGMAWLSLFAPAVEVHAIRNRLTAIARALGESDGEARSVDQLRADAVCDLLIDGHVAAHPTQAQGIRATVAATVPALSLLDDAHAAASEPPTVEGVGPIPLERARELCGTADGWMRVLTHPETGVVLSVGRRSYKPPKSLKRLVQWRAGRCLAPGCGRAAEQCEIDHTIAWSDGGCTDFCNLGPFCTGHHTVKHHGGWMVRQIEGSGGQMEWTSPTGRRYVVTPERTVPVFRPAPPKSGPAPF